MKKLLFAGILFSGFNVFSQAFSALYPFSSVVSGTAGTGATDPTPVPTAAGVTFGAFSATGTGTSSTGGGRFSFDTWGTGATNGVDTYSTMTGALDLTKYYGVVITPSVNYGITLNNMSFDVRRSGTGVRSWALRTSVDAYATNVDAAIVMTQTNISVVAPAVFFWNFDATSTANDQKGCSFSFTTAAYTSFLNPLTLRMYAWNAEGNAGTFSIDSVRFNGLAIYGAGIAELSHDLNAGFILYPNPSNDGKLILKTQFKNCTKIDLADVIGNVVTNMLPENNSDNIILNLESLPAGMYFVRMTSENKIYTQKLFIRK